MSSDRVDAGPSEKPSENEASDSDKAKLRQMHTKPGLAEHEKDVPPNPIVEELGENRGS